MTGLRTLGMNTAALNNAYVRGAIPATLDRAGLAAADTAAAAIGYIVLTPGTYSVASNLTIASSVTFQPGAIIKPASGVTVTLTGGVTAPRSQIFDHSAGGTVVPKAVDYYHPSWWGAVGTSDDSTTWTRMVASLDAARDTTSGITTSQRIMAPAGVNRFMGITLNYAHLVADKGVTKFLVPTGTTTGSMLVVNDFVTVSGGFWATTATTQAVKLIEVLGFRCQIDNVEMSPDAVGAIAIQLGDQTITKTPTLSNIRIKSSTATSTRRGTGIVVDSSDAKMTNVWIGQCATGILFNRAAAYIDGLHVWGCGTGMSGSPDYCYISNFHIESNDGWGADFTGPDRWGMTNGRFWANGAVTASTGGLRIQKGSGFCRDAVLSNAVFDDNTGSGLYLLGGIEGFEANGVRFGSSQAVVTSPLCDKGVVIESGVVNARLNIRGRKADHITKFIDNSSTSTMLGLGELAAAAQADTTVSNSVSPGSFPIATVGVGPDEEWLFEAVAYVDAAQAVDARVRIAASVTPASGYYGAHTAPSTGTTSLTNATVLSANTATIGTTGGSSIPFGTAGAGSPGVVYVTGYVKTGSTAGTLALQVAQGTADAVNNLTVKAGSYIRARRIS